MGPMESKLLKFASNIFKQTKILICVMVYIVEKVRPFEMRVPFF